MAQSTSARSRWTDLFMAGAPPGRPVRLEWFILNRHGKPLMLLPKNPRAIRNGLELYPAQRPAAKLLRQLLPLAASTPARAFFPRTAVDTDDASPLLAFLGQKIGAAGTELVPPAILLGNQLEASQRFVLLGIDSRGFPAIVVKAGITPFARHVIEREAGLLGELPPRLLASPKLDGVLDSPRLSAFSTPYYPGVSPKNREPIERILTQWLRPGPCANLTSYENWRQLAECAADEPVFLALDRRLKKQPLRAAIYHGDFTPWNIRVNSAGEWTALDWERGELRGIPGWDWFHYEVQTAILKRRCSPEQVATHVETLLTSSRFQRYATTAGFGECSRQLLVAYLLHQNRVIRPSDGLQVSLQLQQLLVTRWRLV